MIQADIVVPRGTETRQTLGTKNLVGNNNSVTSKIYIYINTTSMMIVTVVLFSFAGGENIVAINMIVRHIKQQLVEVCVENW